MKKKILILISVLLLVLTACSKQNVNTKNEDNKENKATLTAKDVGLTIEYNEAINQYRQLVKDKELKQIMFDNYPDNMVASMGFKSYTNYVIRSDEFMKIVEENKLHKDNIREYLNENKDFQESLNDNQLEMFSIISMDESLKSEIENMKNNLEPIGATLYELDSKNGLIYILIKSSTEKVDEILSKIEDEDIKNLSKDIYENIENNIKIEERKIDMTFLNIETVDIDGNDVNGDIFKDKKLTVLNAWGTFCGPCINEMPDLQKLHEEISKDNMQVVGVVMDAKANDQGQIDEAKRIMKQTNVEYLNILPSDEMVKNQLKDVYSIPATFIIDGEGNILTSFVGSKSLEQFKEIIEKYK